MKEAGRRALVSLRWLIALIALVVLGAAAYGQTFPEPRTLKINDKVYVLLGPIQHANRLNQGYMINSTVIVGDRGVILVDSGGSHEVGRHIAAAVRRITDKPVTHVVNTHHHGDHYLGNTAFEGAVFISSEMCRRMVLETGSEWLGIMERDIGRKLPGTKPLAAEVAYAQGTRTETFIHGVRVVFWVPRGSHTIGDLMVHLPDDKVLVAGDVLVSRVVPTLQDGFAKNWIRTLDEIRALGAVHFVPGHGDLMTLQDVTALRDAMFRFYSRVKEDYEGGRSEVEVRKSLDLSDWNKLERSYVIGRNINRAYLEIEADSFDEQIPEDVASFVERRHVCDHFRGEDPYSPERRAEINRATEKYCRGTDRELEALRVKYRNTRALAAALEEFERNIEPAEKDDRP
jgi:glyoxylase-like metal-dependent hydrolase (beta-lactamase superfamily II)